jgi:putative membrane protein
MKIRALAIVTALALPMVALADQPTPPAPPDQPAQATPPADKQMDKPADKPTGKPTKGAKLADGDVKIIAHLHHVNQMEIDLGKVAQKSGTATVKAYGETLERDHMSADKDLVAFARQNRLNAIPAARPDNEADKQAHKEMMSKVSRLKTLKGAEFDREFISMMVADHDKELAKIDVSISAATNPELQNMLKNVKPMLQRHADQARDLQKSPQASADRPMSPPERPVDRLPSDSKP